MSPVLIQAGIGRSTMPYDSTQGIPDDFFKVLWLIILIFAAYVAWRFRDDIPWENIFRPKDSSKEK